MHLSKRLQMVTNCVTKGNRVADVGCDHAYISIDLIERNVAVSTIALDINQGPLKRAYENICDHGFSDRITTRLSNGLCEVLPGEVDSIVIAGMGGDLMVRILTESDACVKAAEELILQPQSEVDKVRRYLHRNGFDTAKEDMCIDDGKYYVVIHARNTGKTNDKELEETLEEKTYFKYGPMLLKEKNPVLLQYIEKELNKSRNIEQRLLLHQSEANLIRLEQIREEISILRKALEFF